jgi:hypothetical protein
MLLSRYPNTPFRSFNPDSAVAIGGNREAQPFRSKVDGFVPLCRHRSAVMRGDVELDRNDLRKRKTALKLQSRTPLLLQDRTSLPAFLVKLRNPGLIRPRLKRSIPVAQRLCGNPGKSLRDPSVRGVVK